MVIVFKKKDTKIQVQTLAEAVCISHGVRTWKKIMNLTIFLPAIGK